LRPPAHLSPAARGVFVEIVASLAADHFMAADSDLLCAYAKAVCLEREASDHLDREGSVVAGKVNAWITVLEKSQRALVAFSLRLRISPQSRSRGKVRGEPKLSVYDKLVLEQQGDFAD
jgi:phage terminase small subunit